MKLSVIGTGYVGLVSGTCFAELGNEVVCVDIDEEKINKLKENIIPIYEPGLEELVKRNVKENRLSFTTDFKTSLESSEIVICAVGTPADSDFRADLQYVRSVASNFAKYLNSYKVFVTKSTVPVGTAAMVKQIVQEINEGKAEFDVVSNPEFLREGAAVKDFLNPERVIVGVESERAKKMMEKLYRPLVRIGRPLVFMDIKSAELTKYAANSFLATKISFINEMANFCEKVSADVQAVARGIGLDTRIGSRFLHAGIGYGGSCFPKDINALVQSGKDLGYEFKIIQAANEVNFKQKTRVIQKLKQEIPSLENKKIAIWGLSFKPRTDDIRDAPAIEIIKLLRGEGAFIQVFDPVAMENAKKKFNHVQIVFTSSAYEAAQDADALLILTEWDEFRSVDLIKLRKLMRGNIIIDGRNVFEALDFEDLDFKYCCIGRPEKH